jgi:hypothetical protein
MSWLVFPRSGRVAAARLRARAPLIPEAGMSGQEPRDMPGDDRVRGCRADPVRAGCPVGCLSAVLSAGAFNPLRCAYMARFEPPRTVGDVVQLCHQGLPGQIQGLGPRRIGEIETCLVLAGLLAGHRHALSHGRRK